MLNQISPIERGHDREEIEQVRNLLFGDIQQENEQRITALEAQLKELRQSIERQIRAMAEANSASQAQLIRAMGDAIAQLGNQISALAGETPGNDPDHE
jgi:DNA anti-recombination protein RmuC